ncbi:uncharacterized protein V2V93DRAFT_322066 [Kockiozyma suomiensis]|uniref:uncharacterized protein n=1 Tax=Kockiozyma suomiensis TaxID=1337062 RepID=UPI00334400C7
MKFVALVSGGKDSCFNVMHCQRNGHTLAALANLHPPFDFESHEMDSFMYQTVGHSVLPLYEECFGVPMYRAEIKGKSLETGLDYRDTEDDETEDLYALLKAVITDHPDIEAVSVGAILSTYQRTRVENVCARLGLTALAYLWWRDQAELFNEMIDSGVKAIMIKVAGAGLTAEKHLGKSLVEVQPDLLKLNRMFGSHICGEGGEYETLVLDCPSFTKAKLVLEKTETVKEANGDVAFLKVWAHTTPKAEEESDDEQVEIKVPELLEPDFELLFENGACDGVDTGVDAQTSEEVVVSLPIPAVCIQKNKNSVSISNITAPYEESIDAEVSALFAKLHGLMEGHAGTKDPYQIIFVTLVLRDMAQFVSANAAYKRFFSVNQSPNPPARACISALLPNGCQAMLSATVSTIENAARAGLHVQGRSYWAPANIGPYSQAISVRDMIYLAGQIPLIPAAMRIYNENGARGQAALALQNIQRVREAVCEGSEFAYLIGYGGDKAAMKAAVDVGSQAMKGCFGVQVEGLPAGARVEYVAAGFNVKYADAEDAAGSSGTVSTKVIMFCEDSTAAVRSRLQKLDSRMATVYVAASTIARQTLDDECGFEVVFVRRIWDGNTERGCGVVAYV